MLFRISSIILAVGICVPAAFSSSLQDWEFNVNGTDYFPSGGATLGTVPGLDSSGFNSTTGIGTLTLAYNPGVAGADYLGAFFYVPVGTPFYNEYGAVNGSAASGQTWQIDVPEYDVNTGAGPYNHGAGTIVDHLANQSLNGTNSVPGTTANYLNDCGANGGGAANSACNDFVSMAEGFNFTLSAGFEEVLTLVLSNSNPGGFSLEDIHPVDGSNTSASAVYYSASVSQVCVDQSICGSMPPPPLSPEPATWSLAGLAMGFLAIGMRRRFRKS